ncbi:MAG: single-stranded-DNA-specific exonuclease RecJ [Gammaproteobacteria bacterium]|jgi:single-stranded-DNA-specific exonuclease|nr:single-stranded-DNA-specific exonuclease RecJ [Gammaproteobacteria bacterium]MBT4493966.1 single-stranded-DNA-specific exonuclease RecJ [Gammaproteobacteria bacterium]
MIAGSGGFRKRIVRRDCPQILTHESPLLARLFGARGLVSQDELDLSLKGLENPSTLKGVDQAADILVTALEADASVLIVGDFDADGATSCALMVSVLKAFGASQVNYLVPDRFRYGYGLSTEIVEVAASMNPDLLVTVDNGIASCEGVDYANGLGMEVIVTDHHLPGEVLPAAAAIVNPNQPGCGFPDKHLAGVGVAFYLLSVLRSKLRDSGWFDGREEPSLANWLDLVALGTVADVVPLSQNNRRLIAEGLKRMRAGRARPGIKALMEVSGIDPGSLVTRDLAFSIAPRVNAAGRLQDMSIGIECLLAEGENSTELAQHLDELNGERREIETDMRDQAMQYLTDLSLEDEKAAGLCLFRENWHEGVVGIIAARIKEKSHRPVIAFARVAGDELKGSGRSVQGFHMRDALDAIATRHPGLLKKFGGHAMAAGLSLAAEDLDRFIAAFNEEVLGQLGEAKIEQVVVTDGELDEPVTIQLARLLESAAPWGQGFPEPEFDDKFEILEQRIVGGRHLKMLLQPNLGAPVDAICFNQGGLAESRYVRCAYRIEVNRFRGMEKPQLVVSLIL